MAKTGSAGSDKAKASEQEFVRDTVSEAAGVHFEVVAPHPAFPSRLTASSGS